MIQTVKEARRENLEIPVMSGEAGRISRGVYGSLLPCRSLLPQNSTTTSDSSMTVAQEAEQPPLAAPQPLRLSREAQEQFAMLLLNPPEPTAALRRAFARHRELIESTVPMTRE